MKLFREFIDELNEAEMKNTDAADVNELLLVYHLSDGWKKVKHQAELEKQLNYKISKITKDAFDMQQRRAKSMTDAIKKFISKEKYPGIKMVYWTARPGSLQSAVGKTGTVDGGNPTDVLIEFSNGTFLGISAKSTKKSGDIGFKNPGMGTLEKDLKIDLGSIKDRIETEFAKTHNLSPVAKVRKGEIRSDQRLVAAANDKRNILLSELRDVLLKKLNTLKYEDAKDHLLSRWLDAKNTIFPFYIKVTGQKAGAVSIENPLENDKITNLNKGKIEFTSVGNDTVGVIASGKHILKMRFKYDSQAMAGSIKLSGDPWK